MELTVASWLVSEEASPARRLASSEADPGSLAAATRMRAYVSPDRAAAVLEHETLRRRAARKFGAELSGWFWTPQGLEQATRPAVSRRRADRFVALGATAVVDLGCGCGADAVALSRAGLQVSGVELDEVTAIFAQANVGDGVRIHCGDAEQLAPSLLTPGTAVFCDPARRTASGRTWRVDDFTPSWGFVESLLDGSRVACLKLGPGLPHALIPDGVEAEWISDHGTVVEVALWAGPGTVAGRRRAVVDGLELSREEALIAPEVGELGEYLYEPNGAVIRAGLVPAVAELIGGWRIHDGVAYLSASRLVRTPWAEAFRVDEVLPYSEKRLRAWVRERRVGVLEIKKRGVDADPAELRKRLRPQGPNAATLVLTPTASGAVALVVSRCRPDADQPASIVVT
ncbi:class I SAM-dependent methyltransferase [Propioniciclava tarda]|uniref:Methyltransferase domain-containing protein n=1 Tax=Propioniciclava tarda TaxID=433330 RepID=A0A4Q9KJG8_PROTD|nr:class I SAM-dependent methyltransferase [Propioniciclava tarda]TBT92210.1 methyltransferase domain-containing protein [Propioniciclava tarda]SMO82335.1 Methyltransferase domain-containing protein [Propioniciclava tarda]